MLICKAVQEHASVTQSTGFKAGIAVAAIVVAAALALLLFFCCWRRRRRDPKERAPGTTPLVADDNHPQSFQPPMSQVPPSTMPPIVGGMSSGEGQHPLYDRLNRSEAAYPPPGIATRSHGMTSRERMAEMGPQIYPEVVSTNRRDPTLPTVRSASSTLRIVNRTPSPPTTPPPPMYQQEHGGDTVPPLRSHSRTGLMSPVSPVVSDLGSSPWHSPSISGLGTIAESPNPPPPPPHRATPAVRPSVDYYDGSEDFYR